MQEGPSPPISRAAGQAPAACSPTQPLAHPTPSGLAPRGLPARALVPNLRGGPRHLVAASRAAALGLRCGLTIRLPVAAAYSTLPPTAPKPGFSPGTPANPPPPGAAGRPTPPAPGKPATAGAGAGGAGPSVAGPGAAAAGGGKKSSGWLGWLIPLVGLPALAGAYLWQQDVNQEWLDKIKQVTKAELDELKGLAKRASVTNPAPRQPPPAPAPAPPPAPAPAAPKPVPLAPAPRPEASKEAAKPAAKPVEAAGEDTAKPAPAPAAAKPTMETPAATPAPAPAAAAPAPAAAVPDAAGAILKATEAASADPVPGAATEAATKPATEAAAPTVPAPPPVAAPAPAPVPALAAPTPIPAPAPTPAAAPAPAASADVGAATAAAVALLQGAVQSSPLPPGLPGSMGLEDYDLSPLGLVRRAVSSAGGGVVDWSQWPERHAQAVSDSRLMFEALSAVAKWHSAQIGEVRGELEGQRARNEQLQAAGEAAVARFKALLRQYTESTKELVELEVRQAEKRTKLASESTRLTEARERGEALDALRLALGSLRLAHEGRLRQAEASQAGHTLAAGAAAVAAAAESGAPLGGAAEALRGLAAKDPVVGAVVAALPAGPVATRAELTKQFSRLRRDFSALSYLPAERTGLLAVAVARLAAWLKADESQAVRVLGPQHGSGGVDAALAHAEALLADGQLPAAAELLTAALQGTAASALAAEWVAAVRRRAAAEAGMSVLNAHAAALWSSLA